nr:autotransporter-associated beta strand repeat-containing protein [Kiritimatiellia bacterium]
RQNDTVFDIADGAAARDLVISAAIGNGSAGNHNMIKNGAGTMALTAANTFTGSTTINAGTLELGHVNALQNSSLNTGSAGSQTVTFGVAGDNTYNLGGLYGANGMNIGANSLAIGNNDPGAFTGTIIGTGGVTVKGGALKMGGIQAYSGVTNVQGGYLEVSQAPLDISNSVLNIGPGASTLRSVDIWAGTLTVRGLTGGTATTKIVANGTRTLEIRTPTGESYSYDGVIANNTWNGAAVLSLTKSGAGTQALTGVNTYTGATAVTEGTLLVNGSLSTGTVTVAAGATLGGTGTVGGEVRANGALSAGTSIGTLSLAQGLQMIASASIENELEGTTTDLIAVTGNLMLDGTVNVSGTPDDGTYTIMTYTGTLTDNGLVVGTMPAGKNCVVDLTTAGQVNLVVTTEGGQTYEEWADDQFGASYPADPLTAPDADPDRDGKTNEQEKDDGTDPLDLRILNIVEGDTGWEITFCAKPTPTYTLEYTDDLLTTPGSWTDLATVTMPTEGIERTVVDTETASPVEGFYRIRGD